MGDYTQFYISDSPHLSASRALFLQCTSGLDNLHGTPWFLVNLTGKYQFNDLLGLQAELQYIQKGEGLKIPGSVEGDYKGKTRISYLTIPVLINVSHAFDKILVYGVLGPYFAIGLSGKSISLEPYAGENDLVFQEGELRRFDMGLSIGAGAGYRLGPGDVFLDLRYDLGFMGSFSL